MFLKMLIFVICFISYEYYILVFDLLRRVTDIQIFQFDSKQLTNWIKSSGKVTICIFCMSKIVLKRNWNVCYNVNERIIAFKLVNVPNSEHIHCKAHQNPENILLDGALPWDASYATLYRFLFVKHTLPFKQLFCEAW